MRPPPHARSPAALAGANRANAFGQRSQATEQKHKADVTSGQEFPSGVAHAVYDGRRKIGTIVEADGSVFGAFDASGSLVGTYPRQKQARRAVALADELS